MPWHPYRSQQQHLHPPSKVFLLQRRFHNSDVDADADIVSDEAIFDFHIVSRRHLQLPTAKKLLPPEGKMRQMGRSLIDKTEEARQRGGAAGAEEMKRRRGRNG
uniref:Uncharacterized protein n=1 Tax=Panagrellus redivivus TaxID=6233 RepID=A0A7E4VNZ0_PANRE